MSLRHLTFLLSLFSVSHAILRAVAEPCIPTKSLADDGVPAINSALKECGNGGTIQIPASSIYQVASEVDFSHCHSCTFQIDGTLNISADWKKWTNTNTIFQLTNARNVSIRGSGSGLINGNGLDMYGHWGYLIYNSTSGISISGLRIQSPLDDVFKISGSTTIRLSDISIRTGNDTLTKTNSVSTIDITSSSDVRLSNISIKDVYDCVTVHWSSSDIHVSDSSCTSSSTGFVVDARYDQVAPDVISDISFSRLNVSKSSYATGFLALDNEVHATNIRWDDVQVDGVGSAAAVVPCLGGTSQCWQGRGVRYEFEGVRFSGYSGVATANKNVRCVGGNEDECEKVEFTDFFSTEN
jgi:galacturan 1,4-alpha-galacturonidase